MENTTTRNKAQARKIESWILNQIAIRGASNVAKALGMDKSGTAGWTINKNGSAEFNNVTVRGGVYAQNGQFGFTNSTGGVTINNNGVTVNLSNGGRIVLGEF